MSAAGEERGSECGTGGSSSPGGSPECSTLLNLPIVAIENILNFLSYDQISQLRLVREGSRPGGGAVRALPFTTPSPIYLPTQELCLLHPFPDTPYICQGAIHTTPSPNDPYTCHETIITPLSTTDRGQYLLPPPHNTPQLLLTGANHPLTLYHPSPIHCHR